MARFRDTLLRLLGSSSGETILKAAAAASGTITLPAGTTDFSATGGASQAVKQTSAGGPFTVGQLAAADLSDFTTWTTETPTPIADTGAFTTVSVSQQWLKIGKTVFVKGNCTITTNGTAGGAVLVPVPTTPGTFTGTLAASGREGNILGKAIAGNAATVSSVLYNRMTLYDNNYPGGTGAVISYAYFYQIS